MLKLHSVESGYCRIYYRCTETKTLFCFQEAGRGDFEFYVCTRDGEPSHQVEWSHRDYDQLPQSGCTMTSEFAAWFNQQTNL